MAQSQSDPKGLTEGEKRETHKGNSMKSLIPCLVMVVVLLALWICLKLSGQSFQDYGFDILDPRRELNAYSFAGFTKDETRTAAFKKYAEWRKANPIQQD